MKKYHIQNRPERELRNADDIKDIFLKGRYASLALCRENEPYIVTLSYGYDSERNALYFHCAKKGLKLDIIRSNSRVSGTIIEDLGYLSDKCDHSYRSLVFSGRISIINALEEKKHGMMAMLRHLEEDEFHIQRLKEKSDAHYGSMEMLCLKIEQVTGKASS